MKKNEGLDLQILQVQQKIERLQLHLENLQKMKALKEKQSSQEENKE
jgi:hypothetical protein